MLCQNKVERAVREAERYMHGKVDADSLVRYIQSKGYVVLFYDPEKEHPVLEMHEVSDFAKTVGGFTMVQYPEKYVFINEDKDYITQTKTLAHEAGHVTLKHLEGDKIRNKSEEEMQAETFAYILLNYPRKRFIRVISSALSKVHSLIKDYYTELKEVL